MNFLSKVFFALVLLILVQHNVIAKELVFEPPENCGEAWVAPSSKRIAGGRDAKSGEFPSFGFLHGLNCGVSLLSERWVITAASCIGNLLNSTVVDNLYKSWFTFGSADWPKHWKDRTDVIPAYACQKFDLGFNFTVIKLNKDINYKTTNSMVHPICLPDKPLMENPEEDVYGIGFGANGRSPEKQLDWPKKLQVLDLKYDLDYFRVERYLMKLKPKNPKGIFCERDIGSPLIGAQDRREVLLGIIVSENKNCSTNIVESISAMDIFYLKEDIFELLDGCIACDRDPKNCKLPTHEKPK